MPSQTYRQVHAVVAQIPPGRVVTYGQIARYLGMPRGARTVGWAMRHCPNGVPWHRVVNSRGGISHRAHDSSSGLQRALLESEGLDVDPSGRVDLSRYSWDEI